MSKRTGLAFEGEIKKILIQNGLDAWHLGYTERADILVVGNDKNRLIECKEHTVTYDRPSYYFSKNQRQHDRLVKIALENPNISVYYAIKWKFPKKLKIKSFIRFYYLPFYYGEKCIVVTQTQGYTIDEFVKHVLGAQKYGIPA